MKTSMQLAITLFVMLPVIVFGRPHIHRSIHQLARSICDGSRVDFIEKVKSSECKGNCEWATYFVEDLCKIYERRATLYTLVAKIYDSDGNGQISRFEGF